MRTTRAALAALATTSLIFGGSLAAPAFATTPTGPDVKPSSGTKDNPTCGDFTSGALEEKIDRAPQVGDEAGPVTITKVTGNTFDFVSDLPVLVIVVKGGTQSAFNVYNYTTLKGTFGDDGLTTSTGQEISHVSFCYLPFKPTGELTVSKTAVATYDRKVSWALTKDVLTAGSEAGQADVTYSGTPGQSFTSTWNVQATKADSGPRDHLITGKITVTNGTNMQATVNVADTLDDGSRVDLDCDPGTEGAQVTLTLAAGAGVDCLYRAAPGGTSATLNTATVTTVETVPAGHVGFIGFGENEDGVKTTTAAVEFTENLDGSDSALLRDDLLSYSETIGNSAAIVESRTDTCPTERSAYDAFRKFTTTVENTAVLTPTGGTALHGSASVTLNCEYPATWKGETATGRGTAYPGSGNWFMYSSYSALSNGTGVDLVAGQHFDAGQVTASRGLASNSTSLTIVLDKGYRFAGVLENVKVQPLSTVPTKEVKVGSFSVKRTATGDSITISGLANTANYGIHVDVERQVD
ncbi:hypothetical protein CLV92_10193 [Kineococcus xinjiangensis]|uniref:Uncharacterized protein n=1 Tax=Kineococcus xinjiangensis TaxID=512762 RepID=A0A2S6IVM4_9ACTN|nr:hypothetical protein [Kineococcus xinjiangensis]PPK98398.1 hypothetical protein CLV92_10193 [Kineococcus xinjiangensis]